MKLTHILTVAALAAFTLASCKSNNNKAADATTDAASTEAAATEAPATATPAKSQDEINLEKATTFKGWIKSIDGDVVTIVNKDGEEVKVKIANADDELIEGALIEVKYIDDNGTKKTATNDSKSASLAKNYKKLLGKWATEGDKITFELRKNGKMKTTMKGTNFKSWRIVDDNTIEFEIANENGTMFSPWQVEAIDDTNLTLKNGDAKIPMTRKDSNRE